MRLVRAETVGGLVALTLAFVPVREGWSAGGGATYENLVQSGDSAPGGGSFSYFELPRLGADSTVGFASYLRNESSGVYKVNRDRFVRVAASGTPAPGGKAEFSSFGALSVSKDGRIAYLASTYDGESSGQGLWVDDTGVSGTSSLGSVFALGAPAFRAGDLLAIKAQIADPSSTESVASIDALLFGPLASLGTPLLAGAPASGFPVGATISKILDQPWYDPGDEVDMNESGAVVLKVLVNPVPSGTPQPVGAIYAKGSGSPVLVAAEGNDVPGIPDTDFLHLSSAPSIASNGRVAFSADFSGEGGCGSAVFSGFPGAVIPLVRSGDAVPTAPAVKFQSFGKAVINETGDVVFGATIIYANETTREGIWIKRETGEPVLIAISGIELETRTGPAEVHGVDFAGPGTFNDLHQFVFSAYFDDEQAVFLADTRPGVPWIRLFDPRTRQEQVTQNRTTRVSGRAMDDTGVEKVEFTVEPLGQTRSKRDRRLRKKARHPRLARLKGDKEFRFDVPLAMGKNLVTVTATDKLGNVSEPLEFIMIRYESSTTATRGKGSRHSRRR